MKYLYLFLLNFYALSSLAHVERMQPDQLYYSCVPNVGFHFGGSKLKGGNGNEPSYGPLAGFRFRIERNGYFFAPDLSLMTLIGLEKSPLASLSMGLILGAPVVDPDIDAYLGVSVRSIPDYKVTSAIFARMGVAWEITGGDLQLYVEALYGRFTDSVPLSSKVFHYFALESGLQLPFQI